MPRLPYVAGYVVALTAAALAVQAPPASKAASLDDVVDRLTAYVLRYGPQLATLVAEEHYTQSVESEPGTVVVPSLGATHRIVRSDIVVTSLDEGETWVALRDTFEVDGMPRRDRDDRLVSLLSVGGANAWRQAAAIANESARFNIGSRLITRNINVPTFVLQLLNRHNRQRFKFSRRPERRGNERASELGSASAERATRWEIEYRERERPTLVRQQGGGDQPLRGTINVDPTTGEIWATHVTWERGPGGAIDVTFGRVPGVDALVPVRMVEAYRSGPTIITGEATYSNFRRFQTSARVVVP